MSTFYTINELCTLFNTDFKHIFDKEITSQQINKWIKGKDLKAIKGPNNRWLINEAAVHDFIYRFQHNYLCHYNLSSYYKNCSIPREYGDSLIKFLSVDDDTNERIVFQKIVCTLVTLHPYALYNDPERQYLDLGKSEGGILFKGAAVSFNHLLVEPEVDYYIVTDKAEGTCLYYYPIIVAQTITNLLTELDIDERGRVDNSLEKLIAAGWQLIDSNLMSYREYIEILKPKYNDVIKGGWDGIHNKLRSNTSYFIN